MILGERRLQFPVAMKTKRLSTGVAALQALVMLLVYNNVKPASAATPAVSSPRVVGLRGYRRFHANDSYIGRQIPCTYEEKICFKYNTLFYPPSGKCLLFPLDSCEFAADRQEFLHGSGRLFAKCPGYSDPCWKVGYRMAYNGRCYRKHVVHDIICGCDAPLTQHFLGGWECRCSPATRIHVEQPQETGRCRIPNLRFPDNERSFLYSYPQVLPGILQCTAQQAACFAKNMVVVRGKGDSCYRIHKRGPCSRNHVVALDRGAGLATPPRAEATCVHVRGGCPRNETRLALDCMCHKNRDLRVLAFGSVAMTEDGRLYVKPFHNRRRFLLSFLGALLGVRGGEAKPSAESVRAQHPDAPDAGKRDPFALLRGVFELRPIHRQVSTCRNGARDVSILLPA